MAADINTLARGWHTASVAVDMADKALYEARLAIKEHMEALGATALPATVPDFITGEAIDLLITYKAVPEWDQTTLFGLREYLSPEAWDGLLTNPAPPVRQVNLTKVKVLAKAGGDAKKIIDQAMRPGTPVLKVTEVKP